MKVLHISSHIELFAPLPVLNNKNYANSSKEKAGQAAGVKKVPFIRLCGNWLEKSGFPPEGRVAITTMNQLLIIRVDD